MGLALIYGGWRAYAALAPDNGAFTGSKHNTAAINRNAAFPAGSCPQCHEKQHDSAAPGSFGLYATNDNTLCNNCHAGVAGFDTSRQYWWPGAATYNASGHGATAAVYAGNGRATQLCVQCHNPHGNADATNNRYPSLLDWLEEGGAPGYTLGGCYSNGGVGTGCHGTNPPNANSKNVYAQFAKLSKHPLAGKTKVHLSNESVSAAAGWNPSTNRHVECVDCHNPHWAKAGSHTPPGNALTNVLLGTWGTGVTFPAGNWTAPNTYTFTPKSLTNVAVDKEYELCLKCHSYFGFLAAPAAGITDQAQEFNPNNYSRHWVIANANPGPFPAPYTNSTKYANMALVTTSYLWTSSSQMHCCDCHSEDTATAALSAVRGPHGSANTRILWGPWSNNTGDTTTTNDICFKCHAWNTYGSGGTGGAATTGFSGGGMNLHREHYIQIGTIRCWNCHVKIPHGWQYPHLLAQRTAAGPWTPPAADAPYYGTTTLAPGYWVRVLTWKASGQWVKGDCEHVGGC